MTRWVRALVLALLAPLALAGCLFFPGKFDATLTVHADRSFTYSYKGEVLVADVESLMGKAMRAGMAEGAKPKSDEDSEAKMPDFTLTPEEKAKQDETFRHLAAELAKESGYRTVEYRGEGVFYVDYQISGVLNHGFTFPYNYDNKVMLPWLLVEVRGKDMVRIKAPGFARMDTGSMGSLGSMRGMGAFPVPGAENAFTGMKGNFTLITDGDLVAQNNEDGASTVGRTKTIVWKVTSNTADAPLASIRVRPTP